MYIVLNEQPSLSEPTKLALKSIKQAMKDAKELGQTAIYEILSDAYENIRDLITLYQADSDRLDAFQTLPECPAPDIRRFIDTHPKLLFKEKRSGKMTAVSLNTQMSNLFNKLVRISALSGNKFKQERQINQKHQRELKSTKTISQLITTQGTHLTCAEKKQRAKAIEQMVERQSQIKLTKQLIKQQNREAVERSTKRQTL
ncbi:hypothetical protein [Lonepinella koalarum]|uniref:hypothetical protein n=1 Tax=Lonepinella koalarum TaxID=53417 RepID=UPI003704732D